MIEVDGKPIVSFPANLPVNFMLELWGLPNMMRCECKGCHRGYHPVQQEIDFLGMTILRIVFIKCYVCNEYGMIEYVSGN